MSCRRSRLVEQRALKPAVLSGGLREPAAPLHWAADASVLAYAPEVNRHQETRGQRDDHAVKHVEAEQRGRADRAAADQPEPSVVTRVDQRHIAKFYEGRHRPLIPR